MTDDTLRILVTGASGFIGHRLLGHIGGSGADPIGWTRADGDLRDRDAVRARISDIRPDRVFHLAAEPPQPVPEPWTRIADEQAMLANIAYAMPGHCRLIYAGSMAEYGRSGVLHETDQCTPDTGYGCAKFSGTTLAIALRSTLGADIRVGRLFGAYGPGEGAARLLPTVLARLRSGEPMPLSDGNQIRDFVHVDDACAALLALSEAPTTSAPAIVNIGTGTGVSVRHVCETIAVILGADAGLLQFGARPRRLVDQDSLVAGTDELQRIVAPLPQRWLDIRLATEVVESMPCVPPAR
jgi:GDP-4-dehydro-6-deoxy-D-mannose reductase